MTFWIGSDAPGGVHVLIIGVGTYQGRNLESLPGAAYSASKLAGWWVRSSDRMLDGHHLASIDVLISSETTPYLPTPGDEYAVAGSATQANVIKAFEEWCERSANASLAVLHWVGHGEQVGAAGATHALFCNDVDSKGRPNGIDWTRTAIAIHDSLGDRAICFIDACRSNASTDENLPSFPSALKLDVTGCDEHSAVVYAARNGGKTQCLPGHEDAGQRGEYRGGAIFSQALLWALDGYAATERGPRPGADVHEDDLVRVLRDRVDLWRDMHGELDGLEFEPQGATAKKWFGKKIVKAPAPVTSMRFWVEDEDVDPEAAAFAIEPKKDLPEAAVVAHQWHVDMPRGMDWRATADCRETDNAGARSFAESFHTVHPYQTLELPEVPGR